MSWWRSMIFMVRGEKSIRSGGETAVGEEVGPGDVARFRAREIGYEARDFFGLAVPAEGHVGAERVGERAVGRVHVGVHRAGLDVVDGDLARAEVAGESAGEAGDGSLGQGVDGAAGEGHDVTVDAADVD